MKKAHLIPEQRYQIEALLKTKTVQKEIARIIGTSESTVSREIKRNRGKRGYSARKAQIYTEERKERFHCARKFIARMEKTVQEKLKKEQWSPEQIVGWSKRQGIAMVSFERIYQYIRQDKAEGGTLYTYCRHRLKHRTRPVGGKKEVIKNKISIEQRPEIINQRGRFGDWEIDTVIGKDNKGAILTAIERQTGFLLMKKLKKGKEAQNLAKELFLMMLPYKKQVLSLTSDNGTEFYEHEKIAGQLHADYFFAHPYSSWERGQNENTNGLIRQYIPKKQSFDSLSDQQIFEYQYKINRRPRKKLNFDSPFSVFFKKIALTG